MVWKAETVLRLGGGRPAPLFYLRLMRESRVDCGHRHLSPQELKPMRFVVVGLCLVVPCLAACGPTQPTGGAGAGGSGGSNPFCAVQPILKAKCQGCHSDPPNSGAPFPLVTYAQAKQYAAQI